MRIVSKGPSVLLVLAMLGVSVPGSVAAQPQGQAGGEVLTTVRGSLPPASEMTEGPEIEGIISARTGDRMQVTTADGTSTTIAISGDTRIRAGGGFLGLNRNELTADYLLNGLPVSIETLQWAGGLVASRINLKSKDLKTASMIRAGTDQRFGQNETAIAQNTAATEALRGRVGDIDQYNIKSTTNVYFDTGKWNLSAEDEAQLCAAAEQAKAIDNALLLVVGYTDAVGDEDYNQELSERRSGRVVNYLQQKCGWAPYRMLTPTGMAESDPAADNTTAEGRAQNRRVAVNILVSKAVDGLGG